MIAWLDKGRWTRPHDKMAVYTEILPGQVWGIRVTLFSDRARVEAIDDEKCSWYRPGPEIAAEVTEPGFFERLRGITFEAKLKQEVEAKREFARRMNAQGEGRRST